MFKKVFFHALVASMLSAIAGIVYNQIYFFATEADFSKIINTGSIISLSIIACFVTGLIYYAMVRLLKRKGEIAFNFLLMGITLSPRAGIALLL